MARPIRIVGLLLIAASPACTTVSGNGIAFINVSGDNECLIEAAGREYAVPAEQAQLAERLRRLAGRSPTALMGARPALARPGCWDEVVAMVQAAGFRRIGFYSEDPRDDGRTI
jgi:hypothetical protein